MSQHVTETIAMVQEQIRQGEAELAEKRRMVNSLCGLVPQPPIYPDVAPSDSMQPLRSDEYYGQPLATAVRMVLDRRNAANLGPASVSDIYDVLVAGGYQFNTKNDVNAKRGLYGALSKNSTTFHKLPNGDYGLLSWYPEIKARRERNGSDAGDDDSDATEQAEMEKKEQEAATVESDAETVTAPVKAK